MAERLESGRVELRTVNAAPMQQIVPRQVDFQTAAREEARYGSAMAEILDRMSKVAFEIGRTQRAEEAFRFAAENPPTFEQIQLAKEGLPGAIPGLGKISGDITYYGQALKKARTLQVAAAFEQEATNGLVKILNDVKNGVITADAAQQQIASLNKGLTNSLAKIDGEAAIKVNAAIATHGNTVLKTAYEEEAKRIKEQNSIKVRAAWENTKQLLEASISQGYFYDRESSSYQTYSVDVYVDALQEQISTIALATGDVALHKEIMGEFSKEVRDAKIGAVIGYIISNKDLMSDEVGTREKIKTAQLDKMSGIMSSLLTDSDAVLKIQNIFSKQFVDDNAAANRQKEERKKANDKRLVELYAKWRLSTDPREKRGLETLMIPLADSMADLDKFLKIDKGENKGNPLLKSVLKDKIASGEITTSYQLHPYFLRGEINDEQLDSLGSLIHSAKKQDIIAATQKLRRYAGVGDTTSNTFDPKAAEFIKYDKLETRYEALVRQKRDEQNALPPNKRTGIDHGSIVDQVIKDFKATDVVTDRKNEARATLDKISKRIQKDFGRDVVITSKTSIEDLRRLKGKKKDDIFFETRMFSDDELARIQKQIDILKE